MGEVQQEKSATPVLRAIKFSPEMLEAIKAGKKTQTRRPLKDTTERKGPYNPAYLEFYKDDPGWASICPYGSPGDRLFCDGAPRPMR